MELALEAEVSSRQRNAADRGDLLREHMGDLAPDHELDDLIAKTLDRFLVRTERRRC